MDSISWQSAIDSLKNKGVKEYTDGDIIAEYHKTQAMQENLKQELANVSQDAVLEEVVPEVPFESLDIPQEEKPSIFKRKKK